MPLIKQATFNETLGTNGNTGNGSGPRMVLMAQTELMAVQTVVRKVSTKFLIVMKGAAILACAGYFYLDRTFR